MYYITTLTKHNCFSTFLEEIMRNIINIVLFIIISSFFFTGCSHFSNNDAGKEWNVYRGQIEGYRVEINESNRQRDRDGYYNYITHLYPIEGAEHDIAWSDTTYSWQSITGHAYRVDDDELRLYRVFYCGYPDSRNGCNSFLINKDGTMEWEPCSGDIDDLLPFSEAEVEYAKAMIKMAMLEIHNEEHVVSKWTLEDGFTFEKPPDKTAS